MKPAACKSRCSSLLLTGLVVATAGVLLTFGLPRPTPRSDATRPVAFRGTPAPTSSIAIEVDPSLLQAAAQALSPADDGRPLDTEQLVAAFEGLGSSSSLLALGLICGVFSLPEVTQTGEELGPTHPQALAQREQVLRRVIARAPAKTAIAAAVELSRGATVEVRRVLFGVLGGLDTDGALKGLLEVARDVEPVHWQRDYIAGAFERALQARLSARPEGVHLLRAELRHIDDALTTVVARAAAGLPNTVAVEFTLDLLGREVEADLAVLQALARSPARAAQSCSEHSLAAVRRMLDSSDERVRRAAIDVCGRLADAGATERLLVELRSTDVVIAHAARRALTSIAANDYGGSPQAWERWYETEQAWRAREWEGLAAQLEHDDRGRALSAMRVLVAHPLHRGEAAAAIVASCEATGRLGALEVDVLAASGAPSAVPTLLAALERDDQELVDAASEALSRLTGLPAPQEARGWRSVLGR